jgi:hypothetical protein
LGVGVGTSTMEVSPVRRFWISCFIDWFVDWLLVD